MKQNNEHLENIKEIRSIMEKSSQFISLSGLSGIFTGTTALIAAIIVFIYKGNFFYGPYYDVDINLKYKHLAGNGLTDFLTFIIITGAIVFILALSFGVFFTTRNAKRKGLPAWNSSAKRLIINLFIPLITGGLFCFILIYHNLIYLIAPTTLIFYGLALINASKYTFRDIRYLGIIEIILGLVASIWVGYGLVFWAIGFGLIHIIYGITMYWKYERVTS